MIIFDSENKIFKLDTYESTYLIGIYEENYILNYYYGAPIPETCVDDLIDRKENAIKERDRAISNLTAISR